MSHPAPDPFRVAARSRGVQVEVDLTVDRNRDLDQLAGDLIDAIHRVLTSHGRRGEISFVRLAPDDAPTLFGERLYRPARPAHQ